MNFDFQTSGTIINLKSIILTFIILPLLAVHSFANEKTGNVLVINSYHYGYQWSDNLVAAIKNEFDAQLPDYNVYIEYMDSKHFNLGNFNDHFYNLFKKKMISQKYDMVICCDDNASYFTFEYYDKLFSGLPVVFCGVNDWREEEVLDNSDLKANLTGIVQKSGFDKTFELAKSINSNINKVMLITGKKTTDLAYHKEGMGVLSQIPEIKEIIDITGTQYTTEQMLDLASKADEQTAVIFAAWSMGNENVFYDTQKIVSKITKVCPVPIYGLQDIIIKKGAVGGLITNAYQTGQETAKIGIRIINGTPISSIPINKNGITEYAFNNSQIAKWKIAKNKLPKSSIFYINESTEEAFNDKELKWIKSNPVITVGFIEKAPFIISDRQQEGIAIEVMQRLEEITGLKARYRSYNSFEQYIDNLKANDLNEIHLMTTVNDKNKMKVFLTHPWIKLHESLFVPKDSNMIAYTGLNSLDGRTITVLKNSYAEDVLHRRFPGIKILAVSTFEDGFDTIIKGKSYGFLCNHSTGVYNANKLRIEGSITVAPTYDIEQQSVAISVNKNNPILLSILNKSLPKISESEIENIRQNYCSIQSASTGVKLLDVLTYGFAGLCIFTIITTITMLRLRKVKKQLEIAYNELQNYSDTLEQKVQFRTSELNEKNEKLETTVTQLKETQSQLILSEKMGALGHLVAGIAHEINSPLGAIGSAREVLEQKIMHIIVNNRKVHQWMLEPDGELLDILLMDGINNIESEPLSTREKRTLKINTIAKLEALNIKNAKEIGKLITEMHLEKDIEKYLPLFKHENAAEKIEVIVNIVDTFLLCNTIEIAVDKASRIIFALKNYIRKNEYSEIDMPKEMIDIRKSIDTVITLYSSSIKNRANLTVEYEKDLVTVIGKSDEINQVWSNLIQNAIQAIENDFGNIFISAKNYKYGIIVSFQDNGCGMSDEVLNRIFEPLFTTKSPGEGTGLGMDIVRKIVVENHQGKIQIDSKEGQGTTVAIWLPAKIDAPIPDDILSIILTLPKSIDDTLETDNSNITYHI